jgi:lysine-N-methylase
VRLPRCRRRLRTHGAAAKPSGCATYPATFVFDGEAVRVSLGVECACVVESFGRRDGAPLVPAGASTRADLPAGAQLGVLPETIAIHAGATAPRAAVVQWSRAAMRIAGTTDAVALLWSLAAKIDAGDLSEDGARAAADSASPPDEAALAPWIAALAARTAAKQDAADRWRSAGDRVRASSRLLAAAASSLKEGAPLAAALAGEGAPRALESFYVTAALHGHALLGEVPLAHALRDRAVRLLLARALRDSPYPIALVEAMMRAQGVKEYAKLVA